MSKALLEVSQYTGETVNILEHTDKLIIKIVNYDISYDDENNTITETHNSTVQRC